MKHRIEVLAPAGSMESLKAAIQAGCDAIYIGGSRFGARAYADNPLEDEMLHAIYFCHIHQVKIYMTVNTLLKNEEINQLYDYLKPYYEAGLDAVIVQDMGVLKMIHQWFPDLEIHGSTQMALTMGRNIEDLAKYGVTRIVPARELSLEELECMRQDTSLELEVFVHGALCYCYSGKCLMSSMQGGRSGNRGRCAQPCRMKYRISGQNEYFLSPKELCGLEHIGELMAMGVNSLKIEGRMKRPEYTALVTSIYRKYVDLCYEIGAEHFAQWRETHKEQWEQDLQKLAEIYNRQGFTDGYFVNEKRNMLATKRPKHGGVVVGKVSKADERKATYLLDKSVFAQDVLEFRSPEGKTKYEYTLGADWIAGQKVEAKLLRGSHVRPGDYVVRTKHARLLNWIRGKYMDTSLKVAIEGDFTAKLGRPICLEASWQRIKITVSGEVAREATKRAATLEDIQKAVGKTGDAMFFFSDLAIHLEDNLFLPVGVLKKLRREALLKLEEEIKKKYHRQANPKEIGIRKDSFVRNASLKKHVSISVMSEEQLQTVLSKGDCQEIILRTDIMNNASLIHCLELCQKVGLDTRVGLPTVFRHKTWKRYEDMLKDDASFLSQSVGGKIGFLVTNMESYHFLLKVAKVEKSRIKIDASLYTMNDYAARWWEEQGITQMTLPYELTKRELRELEQYYSKDLIVYGHIPLMVSAQCPFATKNGCGKGSGGSNSFTEFYGEKQREYLSLNCCKDCYNMIYQKTPLSLLREKESGELEDFLFIRYEFINESPAEVARILQNEFSTKTTLGHFELGIE